ncbi:MAG TPA: hypothetical protein PLC61_04400 [Chitinophagales bacterium]|nr:hypothetical protein [Chitinophagales bacterium]
MLKKKVSIKNQKLKNNSLNANSFSVLNESKKNVFLQNYKLTLNGSSLFSNKGLLFNEPQILKQGDSFIVNLAAFYRTKLLLKYRKKLKLRNSIKNSPFRLSSIIRNTFFFNSNQILVNLTCLNRLIDKTSVKNDYSFYKSYKNLLFVRNYNLWLDFVKTTNLVIRGVLDIKALLLLFGSLFKYLNKRKHNRFIFFVSNLFDYLVKTYPDRIKGIKLVISGRLLSKPRSSIAKIERGTLNLTSKNANIVSNQMHVYTLYGAFGLKLYINYQK